VSLTAAGFLAFAFFIAYGGDVHTRRFFGGNDSPKKPVMVLAFLTGTLGSLSFALFPGYRVAIISYFTIGAGMAVLQVAINPLLRVAGGEETLRIQFDFGPIGFFGSASFVSPRIYSYLVLNLKDPSPGQNIFLRILRWLTPLTIAMGFDLLDFRYFRLDDGSPFAVCQVPKSSTHCRRACGVFEHVPIPGIPTGCMALLCGDVCLRGFVNKALPIGLSSFLNQYHGFDPHTTGAAAVSWFWGLLTAGLFSGDVIVEDLR